MCISCAHTLLIAFVSPQRMSLVRLTWWTAWWLALVDEESSQAIHSSEQQLSLCLSPTPWACMRMSPGPCLNVWYSLFGDIDHIHMHIQHSEWQMHTMAHTYQEKGGSQDYSMLQQSTSVSFLKLTWSKLLNVLEMWQCSFKVRRPRWEQKVQTLTGEALWPRARPGRHFCSSQRVKYCKILTSGKFWHTNLELSNKYCLVVKLL